MKRPLYSEGTLDVRVAGKLSPSQGPCFKRAAAKDPSRLALPPRKARAFGPWPAPMPGVRPTHDTIRRSGRADLAHASMPDYGARCPQPRHRQLPGGRQNRISRTMATSASTADRSVNRCGRTRLSAAGFQGSCRLSALPHLAKPLIPERRSGSSGVASEPEGPRVRPRRHDAPRQVARHSGAPGRGERRAATARSGGRNPRARGCTSRRRPDSGCSTWWGSGLRSPMPVAV